MTDRELLEKAAKAAGKWQIGSRIPFMPSVDYFDVQLKDDSLRLVRMNEWYELWFADCTHPAQNAYCNSENIKAWRISDKVKT